ncbi:hypothetical protein [Haladaptatus sp. DYF46]|uniref:hypothetical protein n=1 Tax=Haladaptatus sp. DYF46 TaxID=2886041 RepID=UPI001E548E74|nr:hypothetical protein [Haladaptatus sp. DYF46]
MDLIELAEKYKDELGVLIMATLVSYLLARGIHDNYNLFEYAFVILLFGVLHEAWSSIQTDESIRAFIEIVGLDSRTGQQFTFLLFIGSTVFMSIMMQRWVEEVFGPLSVVQLLGLIVVLSRAYVNVYIEENLAALIDGNRDTYSAYMAGFLAFIISWQLREYYPVQTFEHILITVWASIIIPLSLFYHSQTVDNRLGLGSGEPN